VLDILRNETSLEPEIRASPTCVTAHTLRAVPATLRGANIVLTLHGIWPAASLHPIYRRVKFGAFYEYLDRHHGDSFDRVASGHYARVIRGASLPSSADGSFADDGGGTTWLALTADAVKDQTYFLAQLTQVKAVILPGVQFAGGQTQAAGTFCAQALLGRGSLVADQYPGMRLSASCADKAALIGETLVSQAQLSRVLFPLGPLTKTVVRQLAAVAGLATQGRKDSQGICFLGKVRAPA